MPNLAGNPARILQRKSRKEDPAKNRVMEARRLYRASLDKTGVGDPELYRAMEDAETEWDNPPFDSPELS